MAALTAMNVAAAEKVSDKKEAKCGGGGACC
jgi:hypothetical protein